MTRKHELPLFVLLGAAIGVIVSLAAFPGTPDLDLSLSQFLTQNTLAGSLVGGLVAALRP